VLHPTVLASFIKVLGTIRNTGDPDRRHRFAWPYGSSMSIPGTVKVEWYLPSDAADITALVCDLYEHYPALRQRITFDEVTREVLTILAQYALVAFRSSFFEARQTNQSLAEALTDEGRAVLQQALYDWAAAATPVLGVVRLIGWAPPRDIILKGFFWVRNGSHELSAALAAQLPSVQRRQVTFDRFPPLLHIQTTLSNHDSLFVVIAAGQEAARAALRAMTGALRLSIEPPGVTTLITGGEIDSTIFMLEDAGGTIVTTWEAAVPRLGRDAPVDESTSRRFELLLRGFAGAREQQFLSALESVGSSWRQGPRREFVELYSALDVWFDEGRRQKDVIDGVVGVFGDSIKQKIGRLTGLRDELSHGRAVTLEGAPAYLAYRRMFLSDPALDLLTIVRDVLIRAVM
jgi:hypothetical protein